MATGRQRRHPPIEQHTRRSFLLEYYRENRYRNLQLADIISHVVEFAQDHDGSKFIQRKMDEATEHRKEAVFREIKPHMVMLMKDTFGNFVVQKFFHLGNQAQQSFLLEVIQKDFVGLSMHKYGCRVVQTAIEKSTLESQCFMMQNTKTADLVKLAKDANGNHVLQKCFRFVALSLQDYLFATLKSGIPDLCFDLYGCRVIQCILINGTHYHRSQIFNTIRNSDIELLNMIQDRYGNYVIQHAIQYCSLIERSELVRFIVQHVITLAQQKYASNVVEKCLSNADKTMQNYAMLIICSRRADELRAFCVDAYANYVVQKLIECADKSLVENFYRHIQPYIRELRRHVCGRRIIEMLHVHLVTN